jgi:hypothetical protein
MLGRAYMLIGQRPGIKNRGRGQDGKDRDHRHGDRFGLDSIKVIRLDALLATAV